ncbi:ketopantoate reductase family protein [Pseudacidovorax sp. RU35E]|uniref:ketopantoate reductase family protein n=1 Tax=Pseudacidovorax sp. RU35E TaxID=1907403 RepID=UPI000953A129|nr:ketopantoate reductase [Pseudacidovorax sp. RU35E]
MKVVVMGAGAVGCYYGGMLARAGHTVVLIGRPTHVEAVRAKGLRMQTTRFDEQVPLQAATGPEAVAGADLVLFCVKSPDTEAAGEQMRPHLPSGALVLSLQNGVDNAERLQAVLPQQTVVPAVVYVATEMEGPGHLRHHGRGELVIGPSARSAEVAALLEAAGVPTEVSAQAIGALWAKLILNAAYNALSAIARQPYGVLYPAPGIQPTLRAIADECLAVARADGVQVAGDPYAAVDAIAATMPAQFSSTAQDLMRGKPTEIDHINGYVVRRGDALGVPVPLNRLLHSLVKLLEAAPAAR